jgi:hypothetical protein
MVTHTNGSGIRGPRGKLDGEMCVIRVLGTPAESDERPFTHRNDLAVLVQQLDIHIAMDVSPFQPALGDDTRDYKTVFGGRLNDLDERELSAVVDVESKWGVGCRCGDQGEQAGHDDCWDWPFQG